MIQHEVIIIIDNYLTVKTRTDIYGVEINKELINISLISCPVVTRLFTIITHYDLLMVEQPCVWVGW